MVKDKYVRFDWAMKRMLRDKANFVVLEGLLTTLLGEQITILELLESESNQLSAEDKFNRVDIKVRNSKNEIIIIEIQNTREVAYLERILYGVSKAITEHMQLGHDYSEVKKVISISIVYFDLGQGADYLYHGTTHFMGVHTADELKVSKLQRDALVFEGSYTDIFPEYYIIRVNEFNQVAKTPLEEWVRYLKTGEIAEQDTAPGLPEARQRLQYYNMSAQDKHAYEEHLSAMAIQNSVLQNSREEGHAEGYAEGRAEGLAKGHAEGHAEGLAKGHAEGHAEGLAEGLAEGQAEGKKKMAREIAARMRQSGMSLDAIASITGLTPEEISNL